MARRPRIEFAGAVYHAEQAEQKVSGLAKQKGLEM